MNGFRLVFVLFV